MMEIDQKIARQSQIIDDLQNLLVDRATKVAPETVGSISEGILAAIESLRELILIKNSLSGSKSQQSEPIPPYGHRPTSVSAPPFFSR